MRTRNPDFEAVLTACSSPVVAHVRQESQTPSDGYFDTLIDGMPAMETLFEKFGSDEHPDFMTVWQAISEMVAFYTEPRLISGGPPEDPKKMSEKKCRFCD